MRRDRQRVRIVRLLGAMAMSAGAFALAAGPSSAEVGSVTGSAVGARGSVTIFGGNPITLAPTPSVMLPPTGGNESDTAPSANLQAGPAHILETGTLNVSTQGTTGAGGSVTSSASAANVGPADATATADSVSSTCTASETGASGSATITNGQVVTSTDANGTPVTTEPVPANPAPNTTIHGTINTVNDTFDAVFNEQVTNPDGSITVTGYHLKLLGPTAVGDVFVAQSTCGVAAGTGPTTTQPSGATTTTAGGATTTTAAGGATTTTTAGGATTTTARGATTTTQAGGTPTSGPPTSGPPAAQMETAPPLVRTGAGVQRLSALAVTILVLGAALVAGLAPKPAFARRGGVLGKLSGRARRRRTSIRRPH
jgi:hypothetical protein